MRYGHPLFGKLQMCACKREDLEAREVERRSWLLRELHIKLGALAGKTFENFDRRRKLKPIEWRGITYPVALQREHLAGAYAEAQTFASRPRGTIFLWGPPGSGKSHLLAAIANLVTGQGIRSIYGTSPDLLDYIKAGFNNDSADERLEALKDVDLLAIDDIGAEQGTPYNAKTLYQIIDHRYLRSLPTVITCNLHYDALEERIADRIAEGQEVFMPIFSARRSGGRQAG